jgi:hypothetical protein
VVDAEDAMHRLTGSSGQPLDLAAAAAAVAAAATSAAFATPAAPAGEVAAVSAADLLDALVVLRWIQTQLTAIEPALISAARGAGVSWQALAPALGVASRQAAERRFLRLTPATTGHPDTREGRVRAERDRRASVRAVDRWANANTADLRRLAGQITSLTDLDPSATADIGRLHQALGDPDATALPALLTETRRYLHAHPQLAGQIDAIDSNTQQVRRDTAHRRNTPSAASDPSG